MGTLEKPERGALVSLHFDHVIRVVTHIRPSRLLYLRLLENCSILFDLFRAVIQGLLWHPPCSLPVKNLSA
jgi:hypothetical protein